MDSNLCLTEDRIRNRQGKSEVSQSCDAIAFHNVRLQEEYREQLEGKECDIILKVNNSTFLVHKRLLSIGSFYFRALFAFLNPNCTEVEIKYVSAEQLKKLLTYCYTGKYDLNVGNIQDTFILADRLAFISLQDLCVKFMISHIDVDNCLGVLAFSRKFYCPQLLKNAQSYVWQNFQDLAKQSHEFLLLSFPSLTSLLRSEELNVRNEENAYEAIIRWIDYDQSLRKVCLLPLLHSIRLGLIDIRYFEKVKTCPILRHSPECMPLIRELLNYRYHWERLSSSDDSCTDLDGEDDNLIIRPNLGEHNCKRGTPPSRRRRGGQSFRTTINVSQDGAQLAELEHGPSSNPESYRCYLRHLFTKPRLPNEVMFVIGGWTGDSPTNAVEVYNNRADRWVRCPCLEPSEPRAYHGIVALGTKIYMIGGFNGRTEDEWTEIAPMNYGRSYVSLAVLGKYIYAMGGFDGHDSLNTAERYDPAHNQWTPIPPMNCKRSDASAATLGDKIYIAGGFNGQEDMSSVEFYDPDSNSWTLTSSMEVKRRGLGLVALHDKLYALGGFNGEFRMASAERYHPDTSSWKSLPEMNYVRSNFACEVIDEMVYVAGGFNGYSSIYHVEYFSEEYNEWIETNGMNLFRSALSACMLANLPNRNKFVHTNRQRTRI